MGQDERQPVYFIIMGLKMSVIKSRTSILLGETKG